MQMIYLALFIVCIIFVICIGLLAGSSDYRGLTIPNRYSVFIIVTFFGAFVIANIADVNVFSSIYRHLAGAGVVFAVSFILFFLGAAGGGDSKLATAFALWIGLTKWLMVFLFFTAVAGGIVGAVALFIQKKKPFENPAEGSWIAQLQDGRGVVPYGIPLVIGALAAFYSSGYFDPETLGLFLL
jgi:prepilin peptidase CpaA